jgi:two-component system, OmpR family, response regulator
MKILLVEDDRPIARAIQSQLEQAGHVVDMVHDGIFAEQALEQRRHELIILDLGLPGIDGMTLLRRMRQAKRPEPVLALTARDAVEDRVAGLDAGADDYLVKPFEPSELEARIRALSRRASGQSAPSGPDVAFAGLRLSGEERRIYNGSTPMELSPREFAVIEALLLRGGRVVSKSQLQSHLARFGGDVGDAAIEVYVHRARKKLDGSGSEIVTLRGFGYLLQEANKTHASIEVAAAPSAH